MAKSHCPVLPIIAALFLIRLSSLSKYEVLSLSFSASGKAAMKQVPSLSSIKSCRGILFDVDGTLADSWKLGFDATQVVLKQNNISPITDVIYHKHTKYCTPDRLARHAGLDESSPSFAEVGQRLGKEFDDLYVGLVNTDTAGYYSGIKEMLEGIPSDVKLGALTNACVAYARAVLDVNDNTTNNNINNRDRFVSVRGADNVPAPKPHPDGLLMCCKEMGLHPSECVYIGDSPSDGRAAEAAGMPSIGVLWGSHPKESLMAAPFLHLCSTVEELVDTLPGKTS